MNRILLQNAPSKSIILTDANELYEFVQRNVAKGFIYAIDNLSGVVREINYIVSNKSLLLMYKNANGDYETHSRYNLRNIDVLFKQHELYYVSDGELVNFLRNKGNCTNNIDI